VAEYTPYGSLSAHTGTATVAHKFTGQRQDAASGLVLFPGRIYDPTLGRFLQADPFVQDPADPQMLNRYSYVRNNPVNFVDPSGYKWSWKKFFKIVAIVAAVIAVAAVAVMAAAALGAAPAIAAVAGGEFMLSNAGAIAGISGVVAAGSAAIASASESRSPRGPPSPSPEAAQAPPGHAASFLSPVRYSGADIVASETLQDSWGPDDAIFLLTGLGVSAKAAVTAAREFGPAVLFGLRSLGETGAIRLGAGEGIETLAEAHITRSGRTVLGHFPEYIQKARARGASYFDIGKDAWNGLTNAERWGANQHFLDMIVSFRDRVLLSLPKGDIGEGILLPFKTWAKLTE